MALSSLVKTKTFWGGLAAIATGIGLIVTGDATAGIVSVIGGVQTIFLRDAIAKQQ